jgi:UDP:flavonoid glycosyltransferase YjiC (YdhE family)
MKKMLEILAQLPHRFIVSTGMIGEQYTLADNMYGEKYLDQFAVLQTFDMVISHGG